MTEDQAKQKLCPIFSISAATLAASNKDVSALKGVLEKTLFCVGSGCMMWRASVTKFPSIEVDKNLSIGEANITDYYCGLAGK